MVGRVVEFGFDIPLEEGPSLAVVKFYRSEGRAF
jgi:hypothetical protein